MANTKQKAVVEYREEYFNRLKKHDRKYFKEYLLFVSHNLDKGKTLLDIGCGLGQSSYYLSELGFKVTGVDSSSSYIKEANKQYEGIEFRKARAEKLPYPDNYFDIVASFNTVEHFTDVEAALVEVIRVTKQGGYIVINSPNLLSPKIALSALLITSGMTFEGKKSIFGLAWMFFKNTVQIIRKKISNQYIWHYREPRKDTHFHDADATWYLNPVDLKNYFLNQGCELVAYQDIKHFSKQKSSFSKALAKIFPEYMSITRLIARKP